MTEKKETAGLIGWVQAILILVVIFSLIKDHLNKPPPEANPGKVVEDAKPTLRPEMIVRPVEKGFLVACQTEALLRKAVAHAVKQEKTKFVAMLGSLECAYILNRDYKILSVGRNVVEFTDTTSGLSEGRWAVIEAMHPAE